MKKLLCILFAIFMCVSLATPVFAIDTGDETNDSEPTKPWDVYVSKYLDNTPDNIDMNLPEGKEVDVTLQVSGDEEELKSLVVFCIDKSVSVDKRSNSVAMAIDALRNQAIETGAQIEAGFVVFNKTCNFVSDEGYTKKLVDLSSLSDDAFDTLKNNVVTYKPSSGTNMGAGLRGAGELLDMGDSIAKERKYLVLISDGVTGIFDSDYVIDGVQYKNVPSTVFVEQFHDNYKLEDGITPASKVFGDVSALEITRGGLNTIHVSDEYLNSVGNSLDGYESYIMPFNGAYNYSTRLNEKSWPSDNKVPVSEGALIDFNYIKYADAKGKLCVADIAIYKADQEFQKIKEKANTFVFEYQMPGYGWAEELMNRFAGGKFDNSYLSGDSTDTTKFAAAFSRITNDIIYALGPGSVVEDPMGEYVDFVNDPLKMKMVKVVNEEELEISYVETIDNNRHCFGKKDENGNYEYEIIYNPETDSFEWLINTNVSRFTPLTFTYSVVMPLSDDDFVKEFDANTNYPLLTNGTPESDEEEEICAVLSPVSTNGEILSAKKFVNPVVWYKVTKGTNPEGNPEDNPSGGNGGSNTPKPVVNTAVK